MYRHVTLILLLLLGSSIAYADSYSKLWGEDGEAWSSESRLPEFSFAGYGRGERAISVSSVTHNVKDFGAVGDGETDDSDAFVRALSEVEHGVLYVPEGRYRITKMLSIDKPNLVLRGAGPDKTTLFFPIPLNDIKPNWGATTSGQRTSNYSWSGGFIAIRGNFRTERITVVEGTAKRGAHQLIVADAGSLVIGQEIEIKLTDDAENSLAMHLYSDDPRIGLEKLLGRVRASLVTRITAISGNTISFDRPLRCDIDPKWKPGIYRFAPTVTESGIEDLRFEFPNTPYKGHFSELGFNAIALTQTAHCWVRNIRVHNSDSGAFISGHFNTLDGVVYTSDREKDSGRQSQGHHGITNGGNDNLFENFDFQCEFIHDITVSRSSGNVHKNGKGVNLSLDHHRHAPYENLFTNIHVGKGTRTWRSGGGASLGAHCAARGTFWNIQAGRPIAVPDKKFGPWSMNLVGVNMNEEDQLKKNERWYEHSGSGVTPRDLHEAQLRKRLQ
ncbi:MAG: glycosyl hydrolase family 28-related protein [Candidatus Hydrogenedentota bacterium]